MKYFFLSMLIVSSLAHAQKSSPVIDENKFTVCAITINSNTEKKVFEKQIAKEPKKFNPIVELTDFGSDEDWFAKACASGVRCDQLLISGHFAGDFFGHDTEKRLTLTEMEQAGCAKSCEGILNQPYEVFLMGCNTLAGKDEDSRTPAQYLQVLLNDGFTQAQAEMVVQSRYGAIGDTNKASMQRAFAGEQKKLYGFTSAGPSGQTVKKFLDDYFTKTTLSKNLEKLQATRMLSKVADANSTLATSLKATAFTQCDAMTEHDEKSKNICALADPNISIEKKLDLTLELLTKDDALLYLPAIRKFFYNNNPSNYSPDQKERLKQITDNKVIKDQLIGLIEKSDGLGLKTNWVDLSLNIGFITKEQASDYILPEIEKVFAKPVTSSTLNNVCNMEGDLSSLVTIKENNLKNKKIGKMDIYAYSCLNIKDPATIKRVLKFDAKNDKDLIGTQAYFAADLPEEEPFPAFVVKYFKTEMYSSEGNAGWSMEQLFKRYPKDPDLIKRANEILQKGTQDTYLEIVAKKILGKTE